MKKVLLALTVVAIKKQIKRERKNGLPLKRSFSLLLILLSSTIFAQTFTPIDGMVIGPNFIAFKAEATESDLGYWEIITENDPRYQDSDPRRVDPIMGTHLEFTGNNPSSGPPTSPLRYTFVAPKTGTYRLGARMYQRLEGLPADRCNDVFIKMEGNFTSGNEVDIADLQEFTKFYGSAVNRWGALFNIETSEAPRHSRADYNLIEGEEYTLTVAGRSKRTNIDYWILFETSIPIVMQGPNSDMATAHPEYIPGPERCTSINAIQMNYKNIDGFSDASIDRKLDQFVLQIADRDAWAAAQYVYKGTDGEARFVLNTMQEIDGESKYRVRINGRLIGEVTNDRIYNTGTIEYSTQSHIINEEPVQLNTGDVIQVEFNNTTNGLVPEGGLTATSRGRWLSLELCTTGFPGQ